MCMPGGVCRFFPVSFPVFLFYLPIRIVWRIDLPKKQLAFKNLRCARQLTFVTRQNRVPKASFPRGGKRNGRNHNHCASGVQAQPGGTPCKGSPIPPSCAFWMILGPWGAAPNPATFEKVDETFFALRGRQFTFVTKPNRAPESIVFSRGKTPLTQLQILRVLPAGAPPPFVTRQNRVPKASFPRGGFAH